MLQYKFTYHIIFLFFVFTTYNLVGQEVIVGSGVCGTSAQQNTPVRYNNGTWNGGKTNSWTLMLYRGSEIGISGSLTTLGFYPDCGNKTYTTVTNQRIYIKETTDNQITNSSIPDISTFTKVFDGSITWQRKIPYSNAKNDIVLHTPFNYDKTKNLLVYFENESGIGVDPWNSIPFLWDNKGSNRVSYTLYKLSNKATSTGYIDKTLPITYFKFSTPTLTITLPNNTSICEGKSYQFTNVSVTPNTPTPTLKWTSNNGGTFNDDTSLNPTYTPTITNGTVTLTLKATNSSGSGSISENFILTVKPKPTAEISKN